LSYFQTQLIYYDAEFNEHSDFAIKHDLSLSFDGHMSIQTQAAGQF